MQSRGSRRFLRRPRITGVLTLMVMLATQAGCYTYTPAAREITPGMHAAYTLTDRGRVAVADQVGPGAVRLEGTLLENTGSEYVLAMARVRTLDGSTSRWGGERVRVAHDGVASSFERKLSRQRTSIAIAATVVGVTVFALTRNLIVSGLGLGDDDERLPVPGN